jgi:hypothetical protein
MPDFDPHNPHERPRRPRRKGRSRQRDAASLNPPGPHVLTATGFGDARFNGVLTEVGEVGGRPVYQTPGGVFFYWQQYNIEWIGTEQDPRVSAPTMYFYHNASSALTAPFEALGGAAPGGRII